MLTDNECPGPVFSVVFCFVHQVIRDFDHFINGVRRFMEHRHTETEGYQTGSDGWVIPAKAGIHDGKNGPPIKLVVVKTGSIRG